MIQDSLYALAQIAITIAGFTGLLGFFRHSSETDRSELIRVMYIFVMCFTIVIACFLPTMVNAFSAASHAGWRVATGFVGLVMVIFTAIGLYQFILKRMALSRPVASYAMAITSNGVGWVLLGATAGVLPGALPGYLLLGTLWLLLHAGYVFVATLVWGTGSTRA